MAEWLQQMSCEVFKTCNGNSSQKSCVRIPEQPIFAWIAWKLQNIDHIIILLKGKIYMISEPDKSYIVKSDFPVLFPKFLVQAQNCLIRTSEFPT